MALVTLRPTSDDVTIGSMTYSSGAVGWSLVDDAPANDGTYVTSNATGAGIYFGLTDITLTATQRVKQIKMRIRCFHNSADVGHADYLDLRLRDGSTGVNSTVWTSGTSSNTAVEGSSGWYTADPSGHAWADAVVDRLQVSTAWRITHGDGSLTQLRLTELYVDCEVHNKPVVSAVTVTGVTTTTRPAFSYTYTDADATDPQVRRQIKVFSAAQYGATGFDPATSASTWDSTVLTGSATTGTVGKDLSNGGTYKAYVKAAKSWVGPAGTLWWSDWVASAPFTITLTPPPTPTLAVTSETTIPSYRNRIVVSLPGLNILDADTAGFDNSIGFWVAGANTNTPTLSATNPKSSVNDLLLTATAIGTIEAFSGGFATSRRVDPGVVVSATASLRALVTTANWQVGIRFYDASGATISTTMGSAVSVTSAGYTTPVLLNQTAPANAFSMNLRVLSASVAAATQYRLDEAGIIVGATAPWSPGGAGQTGEVLVERSQRIAKDLGRGPARNWLHPQIHSSGALVGAIDGYYARQAQDEVLSLPLDRAFPGSPTDASSRMIEWTVRVGAFSYLDVGMASAVTSDGNDAYAFPAVPGKSMTYGCWAWTDTPGKQVHLNLVYVDVTNTTVLASTRVGPFTLTGTEQLITVAAVPPAGTVWARIETENTGGGAAVNWRYRQTGAHFRPTADPAEVWPGQTWAVEWDPVRGTTAALDQTGPWNFVLYDHEAPPGRPVLYRASLVMTLATGDISASLTSIPVHVYMDPPALPLLKDPLQPENAVVVTRYPGTIDRGDDSTVLHGMGRDGDPVRVRTWRGSDDGQLLLEAAGALELYRLRQLLNTNVLLLQHHDGGQTYLIPNPASLADLSPSSPFTSVTVPYLAIADPS